MLTGDHTSVANAIAKELGISQVIAQVLPDQKAQHIQALQQQGRKVAMIGDGINDAPALALADIGIAMGSGSDVAIESAQMTLLNSSPTSVVSAIELSKATLRNMKQNLFGAFIYNTLGIPIAAGVLYPAFGFYSAQLSPERRWRSPRSPWSAMPIACAGAKFLSINILNEVHHETHNDDTRPIGHISGQALATQVVNHKSPYCGCCTEWTKHMEENGFTVKKCCMTTWTALSNNWA